VDRGHLNSGAVIDPQDVSSGVLEIRIVEGRLEAIDVEGLSWLRPGYVRSRLERGAGIPLDVGDLEERLRMLREDPRIESIHAELLPASEPGLANLSVRVEEARLWHGALDAGTVQSPSVGGWRIGGALWHDSLLGFGDVLRASYGWTEGLDDYEGLYSFPVNGLDGRIEAYGRYGDAEVVENPFDDLQVESLSWTGGVGFSQPVIDAPGARFALTLRGEVRESRTFLLDQPFSFSPGLEDGRARIAVVRFVQDALLRDDVQVFAARSMLSLGVDLFDSTHVFGGFADGRFFSWLAQLQFARRLPWMGIEVVTRVDTQLAANPLLPLEQFSIGGFGSVRGYRVNQIVRDNGLVGSIELRVPMLSRADGTPLLQIVPFFDVAYAWNTGQPTPTPHWLGSLGVALRWAMTRRILIEAYWGGQLASVPALPDPDLQDRGFGLRAVAFVF
jgi:hemolysin activation/secretion protein